MAYFQKKVFVEERMHAVRITKGGRLVIPAAIRKRFHLAEGSTVLLKTDEHTVYLVPVKEAVKQAQALLAPFRKKGVLYVDDFLRERKQGIGDE